jgi:uncharacterized OB-fold protein
MVEPKPVPVPTDEDREFWRHARGHHLVLPHCRACGHVWFPPYRNCPACLGRDIDWQPASGRGEVFAFTVFHRPYLRAFAADVPYHVALVRLEEGPLLYGTVVDGSVRVGLPVQVVFDDINDAVSLPRFRPVEGTAQPGAAITPR